MFGRNMKKYYFYNPETGCDWEEEMTSTKKDRFLQNRPWIKEGDTARDKKDQAREQSITRSAHELRG